MGLVRKIVEWLYSLLNPEADSGAELSEMVDALYSMEGWAFTDFDADLYTGKDFWNDPARWDGMNPHKDMIWMVASRHKLKSGNMITFH